MTDEENARLKALILKFGVDPEEWPDIPERNAPCLCGSGKKFKKCCQPLLEKEQQEADADCGNV